MKKEIIKSYPSFILAGYEIRVSGEIHAPTFHAGDVGTLLGLQQSWKDDWLTGEEVMELCRSVSRLPVRLLHAHLEKFLPVLTKTK